MPKHLLPQRLLCILFLSIVGSTIAESRVTLVPGKESNQLYRWCRNEVIRKYGRLAPTQAQRRRFVLNTKESIRRSLECERNGGRNF